MNIKSLRLILWLVVGLVVVAWGVGYIYQKMQQNKVDALNVTFDLVDHEGHKKTEKDYADNHMLVYFGFAHCPDFCPTTLQKMAVILQTMGLEGRVIRPLFVTLDPDRDTPEILKSYLAMFGQNITGLTGDPKEIEKLAQAFKIYFAQIKGEKMDESHAEDYTLDHSTFMFWVTPGWEVKQIFQYDETPEGISKTLLDAVRK